MKLHLITDNTDAAAGMRLAGIEYTLVNTGDEFQKALREAADDTSIAIILVTQALYENNRQAADEFKKNVTVPLITVIPDGSGEFRCDMAARYAAEAIGI